MRVRQLNSKSVEIDKKEALRYMGYKADYIDKETERLLEESIEELYEIADLKYVFRLLKLDKNENIINFENLISIESKDLANLLKHCEKAALMAASLGFQVEKRIKYYTMTDLSKTIVFDACATALIESLCQVAETEIKEIAEKENSTITFRYSPGYGDLPIYHQGEILSALNAQKLIGLSVLQSSILVPRKSVTAFIGFEKAPMIEKKGAISSCSSCNMSENCKFQKRE